MNPCHVELLTHCDSCSLGKSRRRAAPKLSTTKATKFAERLLTDNSGKLRVQSIGGCYYGNVVVDEYTSWIWAHPLRTISDTYAVIKHVIEVELHQRQEHKILYIRSDGGPDYPAKYDELLQHHGIKKELTCPGTSYQNGKAERYIGVLFDTLRTMLHDSRLPQRFWAEGFCCAAYVHNRMPLTQDKNGKSPFELRYGKQPDLAFLRPFGVTCTVCLQQRQLRGKHLPRSQQGVMEGTDMCEARKAIESTSQLRKR